MRLESICLVLSYFCWSVRWRTAGREGTRFATRAVEALNNGDINQIMVYHDGQYGYASLDSVAGQQYSVNQDIINLCRELSC